MRPLSVIASLFVLIGACADTAGETPPSDTPSRPPDALGDVGGGDVDGEVTSQDVPSGLQDADVRRHYPLDDVLRVHHIQCKGTHNSTHVEPEFTVPQWRYTHRPLYEQLDQHGVRQVELDVHYNGDGTFDVFHLPLVDAETTCGTLSGCLGELKEWSDDNPWHHLLFVLVEPKDELDFEHPITGHYDALDQAILDVWPPARMLRPDDVRGDHATLREALETDGWPTLGATRQKAMFIMLDSGEHRTRYLADHPNLEGRVLFARDGLGEPWGAVLEGGSAEAQLAAAQSGYLVRGSADSPDRDDVTNEAKSAEAMAGPAHFISSDFPYAQEAGYWFELTGGTPSRCNPVTAPPGCHSEAIEQPSLDRRPVSR
ncbi:MAG: Ca2+-dependent phosphoinositide-specific phospholipase C [Myxococcota bacterium]|jgi:hypothetical protein|nr:Ca2+-dependent phosphoinositide-specific phospholipase C [Myxococcota bacterium]